MQINNFHTHAAGKILIFWNPLTVDIQAMDFSPQVVHCEVRCKVSSSVFHISFVYVFNFVISRRLL